ncbi:unnamed protein product [Hydatigera taeniaeformis]|uniref:Uncharacterized protein n=1 Tax=Hydatigena taeniaeformis TaxID=6205 RepID=A0A3P7E864_HYDTA|nr:unnamed protein product [Hydatigera taeniaeformis]
MPCLLKQAMTCQRHGEVVPNPSLRIVVTLWKVMQTIWSTMATIVRACPPSLSLPQSRVSSMLPTGRPSCFMC